MPELHWGLVVEDDFEFEIAKVRAMHRPDVEQMRTRAASSELAIDHRPGRFVFAGTPTAHGAAVKFSTPPKSNKPLDAPATETRT